MLIFCNNFFAASNHLCYTRGMNLELCDFCAQTEKSEILHDINFSIPTNSTILLTGANGAGKSTILRGIMGLGGLNYSGKVLVDNKDISKLSIDERARLGIFMSFQEPVAIEGLSLIEAIRSALEARGEKLALSAVKVRINDALEKVGLSPFIASRELNHKLSGGEKKKCEIAQMLVLRPKLVLLDEIDSGLDAKSCKNISGILRGYQKETGASFIIVSHNLRILSELQPNQELVVEDGRIVKK